MEEYVVPEFYDVLVGGTNADGSYGGGHGATGGNNHIDWDLETGMTGQGWEFDCFNTETLMIEKVRIPNGSDEEIKNFIQPYVKDWAGFLSSRFIGCVNS